MKDIHIHIKDSVIYKSDIKAIINEAEPQKESEPVSPEMEMAALDEQWKLMGMDGPKVQAQARKRAHDRRD